MSGPMEEEMTEAGRNCVKTYVLCTQHTKFLFNSVSYIFLVMFMYSYCLYTLLCIFYFLRANWHSLTTPRFFNSVSYIFLVMFMYSYCLYTLFCIFYFLRANWHSLTTLRFFHALSQL
jgi:hypothetical protein